MANRTHSERIEALFRFDKAWAAGFVLILWATVLFVFFAILPMVTDTGVKVAMAISAGLVLLFNTASITAMIRHYAHDKEDIYGLDIRHQDALAKLKATGRLQAASE